MDFLNRCILVILFTVFCSGCRNSADEVAELKKENARLRREADSLKQIRPLTDTATIEQKQVHPQNTIGGIRPGKHAFTLQWIGWDVPGSVTILPAEDEWHAISGRQESRRNADYITIKGRIKQLSATELVFEGEIRSVVEGNNNGEPCIKTGPLLFKITKNRKYWRLQDMINCEGGMLTDYVDIYF